MKKITYSLIAILIIFIGMNSSSVKALEDSGSSIESKPGSGTTGGSVSGTKGDRVHDNLGFRVSIVDENGDVLRGGGPKEHVSNPRYLIELNVDLSYSESRNRVNVLKNGVSWSGYVKSKDYFSAINGLPSGLTWSSRQGANYDFSAVKEFYKNLGNNPENLKNYIRSEFPDFASYYYESGDCETLAKTFLLVEPMTTVAIQSSGQKTYFGTVTELAQSFSGMSDYANQFANYLYIEENQFTIFQNTPYQNIITFNGLSGVGTNGMHASLQNLAHETYGIGAGLVWMGEIMQDVCKKCYKIDVKKSPAVCRNEDKINIGKYWEESREVNCDDITSDEEENTEDGRLYERNINGNKCRFNCLEEAWQYLPGGISNKRKIEVGGYLIWPTNEKTIGSDFDNLYPLSYKGRLTCKLNKNDNWSVCQNVDKDLYSFNTEAKVQYQDGNKTNTIALKQYRSKKIKKIIGDNKITITAQVSYKLEDEKNQYICKNIDKKNNNTSKRICKKTDENVVDLKYANLPVSDKAISEHKYDLKILTEKLSRFTEEVKKTSYTCKYAPNDGGDDCKCPEGTKRAGETIYIANTGKDAIVSTFTKQITGTVSGSETITVTKTYCASKTLTEKDNNAITASSGTLTCGQAQEKLCDKNNDTYSTKYGTDDTKNDCKCVECPTGTLNAGVELNCNNGVCNSFDNIINACNKEDLTEDEFCPGPDDPSPGKYYCPRGGPKSGMDITWCVNSGYNYKWCVNKVCNTDGNRKPGCPNSNNVGNQAEMDKCFAAKIAQGLSVSQAEAYCCPIAGKIRIIYRVIDLANPFPGYGAKAYILSSDRNKYKNINKNVVGRYPGANWNNVDVITTEIINNRKESGDKVYERTPLYSFTLNSQQIKTIRSYNRGREYGDFKANEIKCLSDDKSTACKSIFVHTPSKSGLNSSRSTCANVSKNNFYTCENKK